MDPEPSFIATSILRKNQVLIDEAGRVLERKTVKKMSVFLSVACVSGWFSAMLRKIKLN